MSCCPACGGSLVRLPSSRLDQMIGALTGRRPFTCEECLWVGRQSAVRGPQSALRGPHSPGPHRRRGEALSTCPICGHDTIAPAAMRRIDRILAAVTRRIPLVCEYCHWSGRRRPHRTVRRTAEA
jgi:hypothetical protein